MHRAQERPGRGSAGRGGGPSRAGGARRWGVARSHARQSLPEREQGSEEQHTAWGITMSSVSLESEKQGRKSKVEAGELDGVRS